MKANPAPACGAIPAQWRWHHRTLLRLRDLLQAERELRKNELRSPRERDSNDPGDAAVCEQERSEALSELQLEQAELLEVEAALERLAAGTYGICVATGQPIALERLRALPWTRFSREAAERLVPRRNHAAPSA